MRGRRAAGSAAVPGAALPKAASARQPRPGHRSSPSPPGPPPRATPAHPAAQASRSSSGASARPAAAGRGVQLVRQLLGRQHQAFINSVAPGAIAAQQRYGVPAAVTIAQAIEESAWGSSELSASYHNLFGIKGSGTAGSVSMPTSEYEGGQWVTVKAQFRAYHNDAESIADHAELLATSGYYTRAMADRAVPDAFANALTGVYATDPNYGANLVALMKLYNLYRFDASGAAGGSAAAQPAGGGRFRLRSLGRVPSSAAAAAGRRRPGRPRPAAAGSVFRGSVRGQPARPPAPGRPAAPARGAGRRFRAAEPALAPTRRPAAAAAHSPDRRRPARGFRDWSPPACPPGTRPRARPARRPPHGGPAAPLPRCARTPRRRTRRPRTPRPPTPRPPTPPARTRPRPTRRRARSRGPGRGEPSHRGPPRPGPPLPARRPGAPRYQADLPSAVTTAFFAGAKAPLSRGEHLYRDVAA